MEEDKVTSEQIIWCILKRIPDRTKKEEAILSILRKKLANDKVRFADVENYCIQRGWIDAVHHVEDLGETVRSYHTIEVTDLGRSQVPILWERSNIRKDSTFEMQHPKLYKALWLLIAAIIASFATAITNVILAYLE